MDRPKLHLATFEDISTLDHYHLANHVCADPTVAWKGDAYCSTVAPAPALVQLFETGELSLSTFESAYVSYLRTVAPLLRPGRLLYRPKGKQNPVGMMSGDYLLCTRSDDVPEGAALAFEWLADYLVVAGWDVTLFGILVPLPSNI